MYFQSNMFRLHNMFGLTEVNGSYSLRYSEVCEKWSFICGLYRNEILCLVV